MSIFDQKPKASTGKRRPSAAGAPSPTSTGKPPSLVDLRWETVGAEVDRRCVSLSVWGGSDSGRTHFALTSPGPIALFHGLEKPGVAEKFAAKGKKIKCFNFGVSFLGSDDEVQERCMEMWTALKYHWYDAFGWARTIVLDPCEYAWEVLRFGMFGAYRPEEAKNFPWTEANIEFRMISSSCHTQNKTNVVFIGGSKTDFKAGKTIIGADGKKDYPQTIDGHPTMKKRSDVMIRCFRSNGKFMSTPEKCWYRDADDAERLIKVRKERATFSDWMEEIAPRRQEGVWR